MPGRKDGSSGADKDNRSPHQLRTTESTLNDRSSYRTLSSTSNPPPLAPPRRTADTSDAYRQMHQPTGSFQAISQTATASGQFSPWPPLEETSTGASQTTNTFGLYETQTTTARPPTQGLIPYSAQPAARPVPNYPDPYHSMYLGGLSQQQRDQYESLILGGDSATGATPSYTPTSRSSNPASVASAYTVHPTDLPPGNTASPAQSGNAEGLGPWTAEEDDDLMFFGRTMQDGHGHPAWWEVMNAMRSRRGKQAFQQRWKELNAAKREREKREKAAKNAAIAAKKEAARQKAERKKGGKKRGGRRS